MKKPLAFASLGSLCALAAFAGWWAVGTATADGKLGDPSARKTSAPSQKRAAPRSGPGRDPRFDAVRQAGGPAEQIQAALTLAEALPSDDFRRLLERTHELPANSARDAFVLGILRRWVEIDPANSLDWCAEHASEHAADLMASWAARDPQGAIAFMEKSAGGIVHHTLNGLIEGLAKKDPEAAFAVLAAHPLWTNVPFDSALSTLARIDPQRLIALADKLPERALRPVLAAAVKAMAERDFSGTLAWIGQRPDRDGLFHSAITTAPSARAAIDALMARPKSERYTGIGVGLNPFTNRDPVEVLSVLATLDPAEGKSPLHLVAVDAFSRLARRDPQEAIRLAKELKFSAAWKGFSGIFKGWSESDPAGALAWAKTLPEGQNDPAELRLGEHLARLPEWDPSPVGRYLAKQVRREYGDGNLNTLATAEERAAALDAAVQSDALAESGARFGILRSFAGKFPGEFADWAVRQPPSDDRNQRLSQAVAQWADYDPPAAAAWVASKLPPAERPDAIRRVLGIWRGYDPPAAEAWLHTLDPETRAAATTRDDVDK